VALAPFSQRGKFLYGSDGQGGNRKLTLGEIRLCAAVRASADADADASAGTSVGNELALAFLNSKKGAATFAKLPAAQRSLQEASAQESEQPNNWSADDLVWGHDAVPLKRGTDEPLTQKELDAIGKTEKGAAWVPSYLPFFKSINIRQWKADTAAQEKGTYDLSADDVLYWNDFYALNPANGKAFLKSELEKKVAPTPKGKVWVPGYISNYDSQGGQWPAEEVSQDKSQSQGDGDEDEELKRASKAAKACAPPGIIVALQEWWNKPKDSGKQAKPTQSQSASADTANETNWKDDYDHSHGRSHHSRAQQRSTSDDAGEEEES